MRSENITVAYAEDHTLMRDLLVKHINSFPNCKVVADADNGQELIKRIKQLAVPPDICLLDICMPILDGYSTVYKLRQTYPKMKFLIVTRFQKNYCMVRMINIGVNGYLFKDCSPDELMTAITTIHTSGYYYTPAASKKMYELVKKGDMPDLQDKEIQFVCLCYTDMSYEEIAKVMNIAYRTTEDYARRIGKKLGLHSRQEIALFAVNTGLVLD